MASSLQISLTNKVIFLVLATTLIPMIIVFSVQYDEAKNSMHKEIFTKLDTITNLKIKITNQIFEEIRSDVVVSQDFSSIKTNLSILDGHDLTHSISDKKNAKQILDIQLTGFVEGKSWIEDVFLLNKQGTIVYAVQESNQHLVGQKLNDPDQLVFEQGKNGIYLSQDYLESNNIKKHYSAPIFDFHDHFTGVVVMDMDMDMIYSAIDDRTGLGETGEIVIGKKDGNYALFINNLRYSPDSAFKMKVGLQDESATPIREAVQGISGHGNSIDYRSEPIIAVWKHIPSLGWGIVAKIDSSEAFRSVENLKIFFIWVSALTLGIATMVAFLSSRHLIKPLQKLNRASSKIAEGDFNSKIEESSSTTELTSLTNSFNSMIDQLKISNKEVKELTNLVNEFALISVTDTKGNIIYANDTFCNVSKYTKNELIGKNHRILKSGYHSTSFYKNLWDTISNGKIWKNDVKNKAKDGSLYWVQTIIAPIFDMDGKIEKYLSIRIDITKNKENEETIKTQYKNLKKVDIQKDEFASMVTHELKTPLTPIIGYSDALKMEKIMGTLSEKQLKSVNKISRNAKRLQSLINDIFDVQKLELGKMSFVNEQINVDEMIDDLADDSKFMMEDKKIQFVSNLNKGLSIESDKNRLTQVLKNLINNAIDFVPEETGVIRLNTEEDERSIVFSVEDNGKGIPKDLQKKLFQKFYQIDSSETRSHGGSGLGLTICKGIIENLGGKITVESEIGKGSKFIVRIPKKQTWGGQAA
jgi:PAS domain S-box-containing protein